MKSLELKVLNMYQIECLQGLGGVPLRQILGKFQYSKGKEKKIPKIFQRGEKYYLLSSEIQNDNKIFKTTFCIIRQQIKAFKVLTENYFNFIILCPQQSINQWSKETKIFLDQHKQENISPMQPLMKHYSRVFSSKTQRRLKRPLTIGE